MTSLERLQAASARKPVDRKPRILLDGGPASDVLIAAGPEIPASDGQAVLAEVLSPFGRAIRFGLNLNDLLQSDPEAGGRELDRLSDDVRAEVVAAANAGADGICYRLLGCEPPYATPMQYGGFYLERDRELLEYAAEAAFNLLWIDAGADAYLDFVSDLPADAFAWDIDRTDVSVVQMRAMRQGALAAEDPTADILFAPNVAKIEPWIGEEAASA